MRIEAIKIRNYRALRAVDLKDLRGLNVFVGANGSGKTTLFDVFGFLHDALVHNVRQALAKRGGFREVVSRGEDGPIEIELKFREENEPLVTYSLKIALAEDGQAVVEREVLQYRRDKHGRPWRFLDFTRGKGLALTNEADYDKPEAEMKLDEQQLDSPDILAVKGLGQFQRFRQASAFRKLIEDWHLSDFHRSDARPSQEAGVAEHLSEREGRRRAREMLCRFGLEERLDHEPSQLSGGQQQRVAIARALINRPPLLFADEPTGNLDSRTSVEVLRTFRQLNEDDGLTIILVTHDPGVAKYAKRIIHIHDGAISHGTLPIDQEPLVVSAPECADEGAFI